MSKLNRIRLFAVIIWILLLSTLAVSAREYIEVWPEGWSEVTPFFSTSIFADRFFVANDSAGTSFLSVDGVYFKELNLTYRLVQDRVVIEEVVLRPQAEIGSAYLGLDEDGGRHVLWLERSPGKNTINYTTFGAPCEGHATKVLIETTNTIQDLAAFQVGKSTHVVWSERDGYFQIRYGKIEDRNVTSIETITDTSNVSVKPSIAVDDEGALHVAWMETTDRGVDISYSTRLEEGEWAQLRKVGEGSVQDIQQGGSIAIVAFGDEIHLAWSALPRNSNNLAVFRSNVNAEGNIIAPSVVAPGSKPQFVVGVERPELVWQGVGAFGAQVNHLDREGVITNLTVGRKGAFRPEAYGANGFRYVFWLQAQPDGRFLVYEINDEFAKPMSLWRRMGLDEQAPIFHLLFLFMSTFMLAAVYTIINIGVMVVAGVIFVLLEKIGAYRKQGLFYRVALLGTLMAVIRRLPIPAGHPQFFGLTHYSLSYALATIGTFLILRKVKQRGLLLTMGIIIIWMVLYQFFALIPQTILR